MPSPRDAVDKVTTRISKTKDIPVTPNFTSTPQQTTRQRQQFIIQTDFTVTSNASISILAFETYVVNMTFYRVTSVRVFVAETTQQCCLISAADDVEFFQVCVRFSLFDAWHMASVAL